MTCIRPLRLLVAIIALLIASIAPVEARAPKYAAIVIDVQTGHVLHAEDADGLRYPASLTKMMTLFMIFEAIDQRRITFETQWRASAEAAAQDPTKLGLQPGQTITAREVVLGLVTKSANDAAVVAAEALAGTEEQFAHRMTERARRLGMTRTRFTNASGLPDPEQVTTASDMAKLGRALIRTFPHHYHLFSTSHFTYAGVTHQSHNRFMNWYDGADGLKTGYIRASGFNLAASATRDGRRLVGVVMGGQSPGWRDDRMGEIMDASFARRQPLRGLPEIRQASVGPDVRALPETKTEPERAVAPVLVATAAAAASPVLIPPPVPRPAPAVAPVRGGGIVAPLLAERRVPVAAAAARPGWSIQVGAFADVAQARRAAVQAKRNAPAALRSAAIDVQRVGGTGRDASLLRARLSGLSPQGARDACRVLQQRRQGCFAVPPSAGGLTASLQR
ncbi:MAG: D-alanyl-D-alanine carboxypeptidase [Alphaproteobacteria bacterium]|nr:D-alanyl-D-alanine carboxypeptidase [Alphaproteobacteria bacterium]